ncbi:EboA domain-containing protein [Pricia sp. S334]|uniref:EboA domain-containing protein n=1 Tax=Pricia mediterranea TaxID=3076079 RepID=A0ABU3L280_9FLAO|nr:EboA domain-containing protein [Pricia sp. S334]MDT7827304.1 EboA domain-containing protein [Pricia sp. S334]
MDVNRTNELKSLLDATIDSDTAAWLQQKLAEIIDSESTKDLYLTYSLLGNKLRSAGSLNYKTIDNAALKEYLTRHSADALQVARIYLLSRVLEANGDYFRPKVANLIQVADTGELETFLKFLTLLPHPENYKQTAVEALRTNIATIFDAISAYNPYPGKYFNDRQWNQMYLKAAFMQQDLSRILDVDKRANADLARIISDYAHERWAASRDVDPQFWRPVAEYLDEGLLKDMERLLQSENPAENKAGALCCFRSNKKEAKELLDTHPELKNAVADGEITWADLNDKNNL